MNTESTIPSEKGILLIPDVHMDIQWVERILSEEAGQWDHVVFLGDYFDSFKQPPAVATYVEMCDYLLTLRREFGDRITFLLGNHDIPYMEALDYACDESPLPELINECSGFDPDGARIVAKRLGADFFAGCRLFVRAHGFLISHAGIHKRLWRHDVPWLDPYESLEALCQIALDHLHDKRMAILGCGASRGGWEEIGGITWQDWNFEFDDDSNLPPQIVGHTQSSVQGVRRKGRSYCIDGGQRCWALLNSAGQLIPRGMDDQETMT